EKKSAPATARARRAPAKMKRAPAMPALDELEPQLATLVDAAPGDEAGYVYEIKFDGYRVLASIDGGKARLRSRNQLDWTGTFATVARELEKLKCSDAILDGEICYVQDDGRTDFQHLQNVLHPQGARVDHRRIVYYVFDLLWLDGQDLRPLPLVQRKAQLTRLLGKRKGVVRFSEHLAGKVQDIFGHACRLGLEGVIGKRLDAPYREGRGRDWIKLKCSQRQEFVIVGYSAPGGSRSGFGALLLASKEHGRLRYNGKVGTGFNEASLKDLSRRLMKLKIDKPAVEGAPRMRNVSWVRPELVCEVAYTEMTRDGSLRHPSFQGLREDKPAAAVTREEAAPVAKAKKKTGSGKDSAAVGGVRITHPERVMDEQSGITKLQLARYHERVGELFLRYAAQRPLALVRCPEGAAAQCFFQKHVTRGVGKKVQQAKFDAVLVDDLEGVLQLVQYNVVEFHGWGARMPKVEKPDWIIFDLDPDTGLDFGHVVEAAFEVRDALAKIGLKTAVKTTGGKGLHVVAPIVPRAGWDEVKEFSHRIALALEQQKPQRYVANMAKARRKGKIFVDYLRNGRGATGVLPYSPRARPGMHVAMPLDWKELEAIKPGDFSVANVDDWIGRKDPWARFEGLRSELPRRG
ncbi:MAG TPA: DNA ligase D, partial [Nevskiaceae bacterium]|nr:DNA ligase D [Nevskiaceae bacterium]